MKTRLLRLFFLLALSSNAFAQNSAGAKWSDWKFLLGNWVGADSTGTPGKASGGGCSFTLDLQGAAIVRKNHSEYPASKDHPATVHDDLMVIFHRGDKVHAFYTDSEGHEINYSAAYKAEDKSWTFLSDSEAGAARYRLTYRESSPTELNLKFEVAPPDKPETFKTYIEATMKRQPASPKS